MRKVDKYDNKMTKKYTPEEIKNRLSNIGAITGNIALDYITQLENKIADLNMKIDGLEEQNSYMFDTIALQEQQIEKMKCCENCKYNSYWGNELHCNYGLKEALQEDKLVECKDMDKWEIKE